MKIKSRRAPSNLPILWSRRVKRNNKTADKTNITRSIVWKLSGVMVPKKATGSPMTIQMLKMLLPMIFPTIRSVSLRFAAVIVVMSSGREVPRATMVRAIMLFWFLWRDFSERGK